MKKIFFYLLPIFMLVNCFAIEIVPSSTDIVIKNLTIPSAVDNSIPALSDDSFSKDKDKKLEYIKNKLKKRDFFFSIGNNVFYYIWTLTEKSENLIQSFRVRTGKNYGCGSYIIRVFNDNYVKLNDFVNNKERNKFFDKFITFFSFNDERKTDLSKGIEENCGYYCNNSSSAVLFYKYMTTDAKNDYANEFQSAYLELLNSKKI